MDPIHPITPRPPSLAPVAPAPSDRTARDRREQRRGAADREGRRRDPSEASAYSGDEQHHLPAQSAGEEPLGDEDGPRHIDVLA